MRPKKANPGPQQRFRHWAMFYRGEQGFLDGALPFVREGMAAGEPTLVMVSAEKIELLRRALGADPDGVLFADMGQVGANPARIIPAWRRFVDEQADGAPRLRGIGEPISVTRTAPELVECQRHEALINLAFADAEGFDLLCPYDTESLPPGVIAEAERSHPVLLEDGRERASSCYRGLEAIAAPFDVPLPEPPTQAPQFRFDLGTLGELRDFIRRYGREEKIDEKTIENLVIGVNELATNSVRHGGGHGTARLWRENGVLVCEIRDRGKITAPLAGRTEPPFSALRGRGLWLANHICDLIQIRSLPDGTRARAHVAIA
jgi:anti-sigma regulatory factor (Ser/Thr protein kinase)